MFPEFSFDTLQPLVTELDSTESIVLGEVPMMIFDNKKKTIIIEDGKVVMAKTDIDRVRMYTQLLFRTELDKYDVYKNTDFGMTYFNLLGKNLPLPMVKSEFEREIKEKLSRLALVQSITNFNLSKERTTLTISFTINLIDGATTTINEVI